MDSYGLELPYPPVYDAAQEQRDERLERIRQSLNWDHLRLQILEQISLIIQREAGALGRLITMMKDTPIRDEWDRRGFLTYCGPRDAAPIGRQLMTMIAGLVLQAVQEVDDVGF